MEYKILLIKNRFKERIDFSYGIKHIQEKTPLKLVIDEIDTDIDLKFIEIGNGVYSGGVPSNTQDFKKFVKEGKYNAVVLVYGNDCPYMRVSTVQNISLYKDTEFITVHDTTDSGETLNHELFHAFFKKLARYGINLNDPMDTYENDKNLYAQVSNRTKSIALLNPYWDKVCAFNIKTSEVSNMKTVTIKRNKSELKQTTGKLTFDGFTCYTLEKPDLNNKPNISSIPKGEYICKYTFSPKFLKYTYEIKNVPGRSGIRIHSGNYFFDIQGCILLGTGYSDMNKDGTKDIINSKLTIKKFEDLLGKKDFKLIIK